MNAIKAGTLAYLPMVTFVFFITYLPIQEWNNDRLRVTGTF